MGTIYTVLVTKRHKNAWKIYKNYFSKNMDRKLSNDVPGMFKALLERILSFFEIWWKSGKSGFLAIFAKIDAASKNHKLRPGRRKNILRPFFERLWSTLSISNFIFIFWCFFVTWTTHFGLDAHFVRGNHLYRFGYKKASKIEFCWCNCDEMKVHVESFQNPVLECFYDLWSWFYA